mgnify:CR=1 FL=1
MKPLTERGDHVHVDLQIRVVRALVGGDVLDERLNPRRARAEAQQRQVEGQRAVGGDMRRQPFLPICARNDERNQNQLQQRVTLD